MIYQSLLKSINKNEWRFVLVLGALLILLTGAPYLFGYLQTPKDFVYNGVNFLSPGDSPVYYSYITQAAAGRYLAYDLFTSEPQTLGTFNIVWATLGFFKRLTGLSNPLIFHLARLILIVPSLVLIYIFISYFFSEPKKRVLSLFFLLFASGLGAYIAGPLSVIPNLPVEKFPIDMWLPEAHLYLSFLRSPHFILSWTFNLLILLWLLLGLERQKFSYAILAGALGLVLFNFHPYYVFYLSGIWGMYLLIKFILDRHIKWIAIIHFFIFLILSLPSVWYHAWLVLQEPVIGARALQNVTLTPPLIFIVIGLAGQILGAGIAIVVSHKKKILLHDGKRLFLAVWAVTNFFLLYLPIPWQRRMIQGWQMPLTLLTIVAIFYLFDRYNFDSQKLKVNAPILLFVFIMFFGLTPFVNYARDFYNFSSTDPSLSSKFYLPQNDVDAMRFLSGVGKNKIVLSSVYNGLMIPGYSGQPAFIAHGHETVNYEDKVKQMLWFFGSNEEDQAKQNWLEENNIDYVFFGFREDAFGEFEPDQKNYLTQVFIQGNSTVYQVSLGKL
ncbi:MAG: hypothetical protein COT81_04375 [Candidatus Buchananbacteria bacterium CG10_big_fil_rev_8_21_14_0_10_42_9]|uniref:Glycosyltransferase RgtA/B/C/D-like domain-containing protein n=1 Tax=Candidatus Buchananbacteria bacterium CG10_big_fil_rev_8_21_14_0_10_42_9 TaxID=1974526 RepID=A0A2H0W0I0_9BACT|nr:MAG: hypothetical protein COT81_04375 [Candidatus Buchananbacteria bacterium CG10_big_fil_rev_8_21_14_0_10_42_9]